MPPIIKNLDASKYENLIYKSKKKRMYIAIKNFRIANKNYFPLTQGDIVCSVYETKGWKLVYNEGNPQKFGFCPAKFLNIIH